MASNGKSGRFGWMLKLSEYNEDWIPAVAVSEAGIRKIAEDWVRVVAMTKPTRTTVNLSKEQVTVESHDDYSQTFHLIQVEFV